MNQLNYRITQVLIKVKWSSTSAFRIVPILFVDDSYFIGEKSDSSKKIIDIFNDLCKNCCFLGKFVEREEVFLI